MSESEQVVPDTHQSNPKGRDAQGVILLMEETDGRN